MTGTRIPRIGAEITKRTWTTGELDFERKEQRQKEPSGNPRPYERIADSDATTATMGGKLYQRFTFL
jgi:hypothetical protein